MRKLVLALILAAVANLALADDIEQPGDNRLSCSIFSTLISRSLFDNSGLYATDGWTLIVIPEWVDKRTHLYVNLFISDPLINFRKGSEVDVRGGKRLQIFDVNLDLSAAWYIFGVGTPEGAKNVYDAGNARARASYVFNMNPATSAEIYQVTDYQYSIDAHKSALGLAAGLVVNQQLRDFPGNPTATVSGSVWYYPTTFTPGKGPIWDFDAQLTYAITKNVSAGPRFRETWGDVLGSSSHETRRMGGVVVIVTLK